ncbi:MAG TPA: hypothetical protein VF857_04580 [Spirochaetota bacterium]
MKLAARNSIHKEDGAEYFFDEETLRAINDVRVLESQIIYFSAGECSIKEILVKRDPSFSV